jgi:DNA-directed RNA polymerase specialized sigma24 family protein
MILANEALILRPPGSLIKRQKCLFFRRLGRSAAADTYAGSGRLKARQPDLNQMPASYALSAPDHFMTMIHDDSGATAAELSEELIFLIATAQSDAQRKRAADLLRRFARQVEADAFRRGRDSVTPAASPAVAPGEPVAQETAAVCEADRAAIETVSEILPPDHRVSLIPLVSWQD